ncbi:hypothetical protein Hypma_014602 [Hypsizygus marmoreus]|uniref:Uncharacterized protein n=1 Tax=Hypsizygus marmoreus TaxID=39966 RepID=A0A369JBS7_HYPMA|nr:hypothetical protein Hypma_014602 [Hypsizygus marmoreus]
MDATAKQEQTTRYTFELSPTASVPTIRSGYVYSPGRMFQGEDGYATMLNSYKLAFVCSRFCFFYQRCIPVSPRSRFMRYPKSVTLPSTMLS